jgi:hypothetical protein
MRPVIKVFLSDHISLKKYTYGPRQPYFFVAKKILYHIGRKLQIFPKSMSFE